MKTKRKKLCQGYITALSHANKHAQAVFRKLDAENNKIDQMNLFKENNNEG